jgi:hypothetical protein
MNYKETFLHFTWVAFAFIASMAMPAVAVEDDRQKQFSFKHPGILENREQLEHVRQKIMAGEEPWKTAYRNMQNDPLGSLSYQAQANWSTIDCGERDGSPPNPACAAERQDARAAYTQALLWYYSGNTVYAENAINIMNAWANKLSGGHTNTNRALQASWTGALWPRAAEIIRYTYDGWGEIDRLKFEKMLKEQYIANIDGQSTVCHFGNWQAVITEAKMNIAVFLNDTALYDIAIKRWRDHVPAYIYIDADGSLPERVPNCAKYENEDDLIQYWSGQEKSTFTQGHAQETCRDLEHLAYGVAGFTNVAETAYIQGLDLYAEQSERITSTMEFHTKYDRNNAIIPASICKGKLIRDAGFKGTLEIAYNHYANRKGISLPNTKEWLSNGNRFAPGRFHYAWETLTHGDIGNAGVMK